MSKKLQKPFSALYPMPLVLVTCVNEQGAPNIITLAYVGTVAAATPTLPSARPGNLPSTSPPKTCCRRWISADTSPRLGLTSLP